MSSYNVVLQEIANIRKSIYVLNNIPVGRYFMSFKDELEEIYNDINDIKKIIDGCVNKFNETAKEHDKI